MSAKLTSVRFGASALDVVPEFSIPSFGAMIAAKVMVPSTSSNYFAVDQHLVYQLAMPHLSRISFDAAWYVETYPDIGEAVAAGTVASAHQHYLRYGYYEHRLPRKIQVNEEWYLENYKDVRDAIARRSYTSAQEHFQLAGFREGRLPYPNFVLTK